MPVIASTHSRGMVVAGSANRPRPGSLSIIACQKMKNNFSTKNEAQNV